MRRKIVVLLGCILGLIGGNVSQGMPHEVNEIVLIADPKVLAVPIKDNQEVLIDLKDQKIIQYGLSPEIPNNTDYTKMRKAVYEKLVQAQALLPKGVHFCLYEAYRSISLQRRLFENRFKIVADQNPTWDRDRVFTETTKLVSPVQNRDGSENVPPHSTGGAIDVYLVDDQGYPLEMGIHPKEWINDGGESLTDSRKISDVARKNRNIMSHALIAVGFVNYPTEYWHWSYGDRYWAYHLQQPVALYGSVVAAS